MKTGRTGSISEGNMCDIRPVCHFCLCAAAQRQNNNRLLLIHYYLCVIKDPLLKNKRHTSVPLLPFRVQQLFSKSSDSSNIGEKEMTLKPN